MDAQDVADQQRALGRARRRDDFLGRRERVGERLLAKDVRARFQRLQRHRRVEFGIGGDRDRIGLQRGKRGGKILEARNAGKFGVEIAARGGFMRAQADEIEALDRLVGARVARPHRSQAHCEHALLAR